MPWLSIFMAILTFFLSGGTEKKNRNKALLAAGLVGAGTYYVSHETDWGKNVLGDLDGVVTSVTDGTEVVDTDGKPIQIDGKPVTVPVKPSGGSSTTGFWDVLQSWGPAGTAVVGGTAVGALTGNKWLLYGGIAVLAVMLLK